MSIAARDWAWSVKGLTAHRRNVLLRLAEHADEQGRAHPTIAQLRDGCEMSQHGIINCLAWLISHGLAAKRPGGGRGNANEYYLRISAVPNSLNSASNDINSARETLNPEPETLHMKSETLHPEDINSAYEIINSASRVTTTVIDQPSLTVIDQPSLDLRGRRAKKTAPTWGNHTDQEAFTQVEVARYAGLWTDLEVRERIDLALCHKSARNYARLDLYVTGWLRRDAESQRRTNGQHQNHPARKPAADTGVAGWLRFRPQGETPH